MKKIIFFDIDRVLFNSEAFLEDFYTRFLKKYGFEYKKYLLVETYNASKAEGYFNPEIFLKNTSIMFNVDLSEIKKLFWNQEIINSFLYKDVLALEGISNEAEIGIFSKGDIKFQGLKLKTLERYIKKENIYILPNKIEKLRRVFSAYKDYKKFLVDDEFDVLQVAKEMGDSIFTIWVNRKDKIENGDNIDARVTNLNTIESLLGDLS